MSSRRRRYGLALPLILISGGVLLLLGNLGLIDVPSWSTLLRFWPVLLIAMGIDLVFGRSSLSGVLSGILAVALLVALGMVGFRLFAPSSWQTRLETVSIELEEASVAEIDVSCDACELEVAASESAESLVSGRLRVPQISSLQQTVVQKPDVRSVELKNRMVRWLPWRVDSADLALWQINLSTVPAIALSASARGDLTANLRHLQIEEAVLTSTAGDVRVEISDTGGAEYVVLCDDLTLILPEGLSLLIDSSTSDALALGEGLVQSGSRITTASPGRSGAQATLRVREAETITVLSAGHISPSLSPNLSPNRDSQTSP